MRPPRSIRTALALIGDPLDTLHGFTHNGRRPQQGLATLHDRRLMPLVADHT